VSKIQPSRRIVADPRLTLASPHIGPAAAVDLLDAAIPVQFMVPGSAQHRSTATAAIFSKPGGQDHAPELLHATTSRRSRQHGGVSQRDRAKPNSPPCSARATLLLQPRQVGGSERSAALIRELQPPLAGKHTRTGARSGVSVCSMLRTQISAAGESRLGGCTFELALSSVQSI
jgi:hypothetical protein